MKETEEFYLFWRHEFGQWTLREIVDENDVIYNCCEQYMMAHKALLFGDTASYQWIMQEASPKRQQQLGRQVKGFEHEVWKRNRQRIVQEANVLKFTQHEDLKQRLLQTGQKTLAEASPEDLIWGIGFEADAPEAVLPEKWTGQNLLGKALMQVRKQLEVSEP